MQYIDLVFDGPPSPDGPRFIEAEDPSGKSVNVGQWIDRGATWSLRLTLPPPDEGYTMSAYLVEPPPVSDAIAATARECLDAVDRFSRGLLILDDPMTENDRDDLDDVLTPILARLVAGERDDARRQWGQENAGWQDEVLGMIVDRLKALGCCCEGKHTAEQTPPMCYDDWITCAVAKRAKERDTLQARVAVLEASEGKLRAALEFYAKSAGGVVRGQGLAEWDNGERARAALRETGGGDG